MSKINTTEKKNIINLTKNQYIVFDQGFLNLPISGNTKRFIRYIITRQHMNNDSFYQCTNLINSF